MVKLFSALGDVSFTGAQNLVLPSLSVGNVGQLALDLLIHSLALPRAGRLESRHIVPVVGNDPFTERKGVVTTAIELFYHEPARTLFLQQRSPVLTGHASDFASELLQWISSVGLQRILFLSSCESGLRFAESQLHGAQLRYLSVGNEELNFRAHELSWTPLEEVSLSEVLKRGTPSERIWTLATEQRVACGMLVLFCAEGNNIPEGTSMASYAASALNLSHAGEWRAPPSWATLFAQPPVETSLFM